MTSRRLKRAIAAGLFAGATMLPAAGLAAEMKIAIAQFGVHPQLDLVVTSFKEELAKAGYTEGDKVEFFEIQVNFDSSLIPQMVTKLQGDRPKLMLTVTTPVTQGAKQILTGTGIPIIFSAVTDPVAAGLVPAWDKAGEGITGASDLQDIDAVIAFIRRLFPDAKRLAFPYNPGEDNDIAQLKLVRKFAPGHGFAVVELGIDNTNDISIRVTSLAGKADVMYVPASNLLQPAVPAIAAAAQQIKLPIVNASRAEVEKGLVPASFEVDYSQVGRNAARLAVEYLGGKAIADIAPLKPVYEDHSALINKSQMAVYGKDVPADLMDCGCFVE